MIAMGTTDEVVSAGVSLIVLKSLFGSAMPKEKKESSFNSKKGKSGWKL